MKTYQIKIVMSDGSVGEHQGQYACSIDAVVFAMNAFPEAQRISAQEVL